MNEILVAAGRAPNVEGLNLEAAGVAYNKKGIEVNDYLQTTNPNIYAAGDVGLKYQFTHTADASARIVLQNALFMRRKKVSTLTVPWCTYTDPEVAHVGLSICAQFKAAKAVRNCWVRTGRLQYSSKRIVGDRFCLLGHAVGFIDPLYSKDYIPP